MAQVTESPLLPALTRNGAVPRRAGGRANRPHPAYPGLPGHGAGAQADPPGGGQGGRDRPRDRRGRGGVSAGRSRGVQRVEADARRRRAFRMWRIRALSRGLRIRPRVRDDRGGGHRPADRRADGGRRAGGGAAARYRRLARGGIDHAPVSPNGSRRSASRRGCGSPGGWGRATRTGWAGRWRRGGWRSRRACSGCWARTPPRSPCSKAARCSRRCRARGLYGLRAAGG